MKSREMEKLGVPKGPVRKAAIQAVTRARAVGRAKNLIAQDIQAVVENTEAWLKDSVYGDFALMLKNYMSTFASDTRLGDPAPWKQWGEDIDPNAQKQLINACDLPVAVQGALMPDAHLGFGLPIGGVLATRNAVIPKAVGVDIACRMKLTILDREIGHLDRYRTQFIQALEKETSFGIGAGFSRRRNHAVLDEDWSDPILKAVQDRAHKQLGSSGSGNHFVEFGTMTVTDSRCGLDPGEYVALLSHSGSRGAGAYVADHWSRLAKSMHPHLSKHLQDLAWIDIGHEEGQRYWNAMQLMGKYAEANHDCIHKGLLKSLGAHALASIENHHNFAWVENHGGEDLIVHRKGATPASEGELGVIPGSMTAPTYVVIGRGNADSLRSSSHGAGRRMSRKKAKLKYRASDLRKAVEEAGVHLISAGIDESPMVYKDIDQVMAAQRDLVETLATFTPRIVRMADPGEKPED
ncbi:MAG: RtcB family protein [Planctomycetia bacterium]|nr:RtcB family protein [Planctomycetia bacterium]MBL6915889.1 RtcB family protein [Planctomycetota bacterium]